MSKRDAPKELWLPPNDWETSESGRPYNRMVSAPWIRASWASDAWDDHGVRYVRADLVPMTSMKPSKKSKGRTNGR